MLKIAIAGATGYTGAELIRLLVQHPKVEIVCVTSEQSSGEPVATRLPFLKGFSDLTLEKFDADRVAENADLIFSALSHTKAMKPVSHWINAGKKVVDLSADYRLQSVKVYEKWYSAPHQQPALLKKAVYGLPEIYRKKIAKACLIANPGCYPTGALLPLYPFLKSGVVDTAREIIIDAKSGVTGAGRSPNEATHFPEVNEGLVAYNVGTHRHIPEIEQEIASFGGCDPARGAAPCEAKIIFTPYLLPINRGILTTIYLPLKRKMTQDQLEEVVDEYSSEFFIRLIDHAPNLRDVRGSNFCDIAVFATPRGSTAILISAIDNLVKGASGQAIHNMNIMMGWDEQLGLTAPPIFP
jgi:N-acetyl-gamma-glutamyl-phosphate reductase